LATAFHSYYNSSKFLDAEAAQRNAILALCEGTKQILANGLNVLGVSVREKM
jgi:arginyl-tRNA synthetase